MRRTGSRALSVKTMVARDQLDIVFSSRPRICLLSAYCSSHSCVLPLHTFHHRTFHSTLVRTQQAEATSQTAALSTVPLQSSANNTGSTRGTASTPSSSSSSTSSTGTGPVSVTAVTTPLSRSAAAQQSASTSPSPLRLLRVPDLELGDAKLSKWLVQPATHFSTDCVLCELDTDMAIIEYKADRPGWLALHTVEEGEEVHVDQPIAVACEKEEQIERVSKEWGDKVERKEREREQRAERPAHSLSEEVAKMKE